MLQLVGPNMPRGFLFKGRTDFPALFKQFSVTKTKVITTGQSHQTKTTQGVTTLSAWDFPLRPARRCGSFGHKINHFLTKLIRSRWLDNEFLSACVIMNLDCD